MTQPRQRDTGADQRSNEWQDFVVVFCGGLVEPVFTWSGSWRARQSLVWGADRSFSLGEPCQPEEQGKSSQQTSDDVQRVLDPQPRSPRMLIGEIGRGLWVVAFPHSKEWIAPQSQSAGGINTNDPHRVLGSKMPWELRLCQIFLPPAEPTTDHPYSWPGTIDESRGAGDCRRLDALRRKQIAALGHPWAATA